MVLIPVIQFKFAAAQFVGDRIHSNYGDPVAMHRISAAFSTEFEKQQMQIIMSVCTQQRILHYESESKSEEVLFCFSQY